jgi:hypothetical protein
MRLLDSRTLTFQEFFHEESRPEYAILSHRWEEDEVTHKDMRKHRALAEKKKGFAKIQSCAERAREDGYNYFWIDTCCIDKASSAELSEAINSMFRWYRNAAVCYVYLSDVGTLPKDLGDDWHAWAVSEFEQSAWFLRGWTLQELIAPRSLIFYARDWSSLGTREGLAYSIEATTGVPHHVLTTADLSNTSLALRMSWAAKRQTTRIEDNAYCLLGLFDINMPMLYGEGHRAFIRLQEEIIKTSDDMSIFAWVDPDASFATYSGLLAKSPSCFADCHNVRWVCPAANPPFERTNKGIRIALELTHIGERQAESIAVLRGVHKRTFFGTTTVGLHLHKIGDDQYARVALQRLANIPEFIADRISVGSPPLTTFFVRQSLVMETGDHSRACSVALRVESDYIRLEAAQPAQFWDDKKALLSYPNPPMAIKHPPCFKLQLTSASTVDTIHITVDISKPWGECVEVDTEWRMLADPVQPLSPAYSIHCEKQGQGDVKIGIRRGLFDHESRIILDVDQSSRRRWVTSSLPS